MISTSSDLITLIDRVANGDRKAFSEVYQSTSAKLYGVVLRILKNREHADDVLQDVYIKLWQRAGKFDPQKASPMTWLCTIARNSAIDEIRRVGPAVVETDYSELVSDTGLSPDDGTQVNQDLSRLNECLERLDEQQRRVIIQAYLDGYTRGELAELNEIPVGTIKSWLRRALMKLRECLGL